MPTPLEILLDPVSLWLLGLYATLMLWEGLLPARKLPHIPYWQVKGLVSFIIFFYLTTYLPLWYAKWLPATQLINLTNINVVFASMLSVLLYEFGMYVWHRSMHKHDL